MSAPMQKDTRTEMGLVLLDDDAASVDHWDARADRQDDTALNFAAILIGAALASVVALLCVWP